MTSLKGASLIWRAEVVTALHEAGLRTATAAPEPKGLPLHERCRGDVAGVPGWTVAIRNQRDLALAEAADEVAREARAEGNDLFVSIQHRTGRPTSQAYCTMPLSVLLNLLPRPDLSAPGHACKGS